MTNIFLTGSTGVVGSEVLKTLIKNKDNTIYLLIRAKETTELNKKLDKLYSYIEVKDRPKNIIPLQGDISEKNLGLSAEKINELSGLINIVIHSAANVKMNQPLESARRNTLKGTQHIFEWSATCENLQKIVYISTVGVNGKSLSTLSETNPPKGVSYHNTYEQAKAEVEFYIFEKWFNRLPTTIIRPSMVVGHSQTGIILSKQIFYYICQFLINGDPLHLSPNINQFTLDTIPVNHLADFIAKTSFDPTTNHHVFNACTGYEYALTLKEIHSIISNIYQERKKPLPKVKSFPLPAYQLLLCVLKPFVSKDTRKAIFAFSHFLDYLKNSPQFSNQNFQKQALAYNSNIQPPAEYLPNVLDRFINTQQD